MEYEIPLKDLEIEVDIILHSLKAPFKKVSAIKGVSNQFVCGDFGVVVSCINRADYSFVKKAVMNNFPGYRYVYVSTFDNLIKAKEEIIWTLMQGGFMKYIRQNFPRQFNSLIVSHDFGNKIINERLRRWADKPRFKYFIDENKKAKEIPTTMVLANDPGFFDYMP